MMSCFYIFSALPFVCICFTGILYGLEQEDFYVRAANVSRTERPKTDRFYLTVLNTSSCDNLQNVASEKVGGSCNVVPAYLGMCSFLCRCSENTSSFVVSEKKCVHERGFKEGKSIPSRYSFISVRLYITVGDTQ